MPFLKDRNKIITSRSQQLTNLTLKNGLRHAIFNPLCDKYVGEWSNNVKSGKGALVTRFRDLYEGDFTNNRRHGFGVLAYELPNGTFVLEYRGDWKHGKRDGFGLQRYRDGSVYMGEWRRGKRHGFGRMWYLDGGFYEGEFRADKRHGCGMLLRADDNWYEGEWAADVKHGRGVFVHAVTGQMQRGVWTDDYCVCSFVCDIMYRQNAIRPTRYPIQDVSEAFVLCL